MKYLCGVHVGNQNLYPNYVNSGDFLKFQGQRAVFATTEIQNPAYFVYLLGIAHHLKKINCTIEFVFFVEPKQLKFKKAIEFFEKELGRLGLYNSSVIRILAQPVLDRHKGVLSQLNLMRTIADFKTLDSKFQYLSNSIYSTYCSNYSLTSDPRYPLRRLKKSHVGLGEDFLITYEGMISLLSARNYDVVFFFNGRYPSQASIKEAAEEFGVDWFVVEHGSVPESSVHIERFQTQDRSSIQEFILGWSRGLSAQQASAFTTESRRWLKRQQEDGSQNPFLRVSSDRYNWQFQDKKLATIFTSSLDEEIACPGWGGDNIQSLIRRTVLFCKMLSSEGYEPVVVIHPNTGNKTWHDLSLMYRTFSRESISCIPPWAAVSSYRLADQSEVIATWRSTIGLEMISKNICINLLSESQYDLLLNPRRIKDDDFSYSGVSDGTQDSYLANLIVYYYNYHGYRLESFLDGVPLSSELFSFQKILLEKNWVLGVRRRLKIILVLFRGFSATPNEYSKFLQPILGIRLSKIVLKVLQNLYARRYLYGFDFN